MQLFRSATLKLTIWYLAILMTLSLAFSFIIYQMNFNVINARLQTLQENILDDRTLGGGSRLQPLIFTQEADDLRQAELRQASHDMIVSLLKINLVVLIAGGIGSYLMAKRTLRPIETAHEAQSRFTSDASHELRTPLSAIKAEIEVNLRDKNLTIEEARELLNSNLEEVDKLIALSELLLHLSRLEYDKLEVTRVDVPKLFNEIIERHPQKDRFVVKARKSAITYANEAGIAEVMDILMENSLKYSPITKPIVVKIFEQNGTIGFRIKNNGPAIDKQAIDRLFDRFYRADTSRSNSSMKGYGLGLSIAKKIVDLHNGYMTVSSNAKETSFTFYLPIVKSLSGNQTKASA